MSGFTKRDRLLPVVTLVVHFGQEPWDGPLSIHEMLETDNEAIRRFVADYRINMISPISMDIREIEQFRSDFRQLAGFIHYGHDRNALDELIGTDDAFRHLDYLTAEIAKDVTGTDMTLKRNQKGEVDMCTAIAEMKEEARQQGKLEGIAEGKLVGIAEGILQGENNGMKKLLFQLYQEGLLSLDIAIQKSGMEKQEFQTAYHIYFSDVDKDCDN